MGVWHSHTTWGDHCGVTDARVMSWSGEGDVGLGWMWVGGGCGVGGLDVGCEVTAGD